MTMNLYNPGTGDGLFEIQAKGFYALEVLNTARLTTVPTEVQDFLAQFQLLGTADELDVAKSMEGLPVAVESWQSYGESLTAQIAANCQQLLIELVADDADQPDAGLQTALEYLIDALVAGDYYVDGNTVTITLAADAGNVGDVAILYTEKRGDGKTEENVLAEAIAVTVSATSDTRPTLKFEGKEAQGNRLAQDWPKGSGCNSSISATDPASSLLSNGDFEDAANDDVPDNWQVVVGDPGSTIKLSAPEVQTVVVAGTPTDGTYVLQWENAEGILRATVTLAYNASGSAVQTALRAIPGLSKVTVATTGTSPNYTHTITFTGVGGDPNQLTSLNYLEGTTDTPTITHATTTPGEAGSFKGVALELDSDGAEATALYHKLTVAEDTVYFCHLRAIRVDDGTTAPAAGEIKVEITDEIGGLAIDDSAGNENSLTIDVTALSTSAHESEWFSFRVPPSIDQPVYLRIRISTLIDAVCSVFIDEVAVIKGSQLYTGGPWVAAVSGKLPALSTDEWTFTVANNRAGELQEWYNRCFDMAGKGLLLPVSGAGTSPTLIPDSIIA